MFFLTLNNIKFNYIDKNLSWKLYIIAKVLLIIKQNELIRKKKFIAITFNLENKAFVIYIAFIS